MCQRDGWSESDCKKQKLERFLIASYNYQGCRLAGYCIIMKTSKGNKNSFSLTRWGKTTKLEWFVIYTHVFNISGLMYYSEYC